MADEVTRPRPVGEEEVQDIQIALKSNSNPVQIRELRVSYWLEVRLYIKSHSQGTGVSLKSLKSLIFDFEFLRP